MGKRYTIAQRSGWIKKWEASGLSIGQFSKGKPFSATTLYNWRSEFDTCHGFVPLEVEKNGRISVKINYPNGVVIEILEGCDVEQLRILVGC